MNYYEKLIQDYKQYNIKKGICASKSIENQLSLEEPCILIWEDTEQNIRFSPYYEFMRYKKMCSKLINIVDDNNKLNDIYLALFCNTENYEGLINELNDIINRSSVILSLK